MNLNTIINHFLVKKILIIIYITIFVFLIMNYIKTLLPQESINYINKDSKNMELNNFYVIEEEKEKVEEIPKSINKEYTILNNFIAKGKIIDENRKIAIIEHISTKKSYVISENDNIENLFNVIKITSEEIVFINIKNKKQEILKFENKSAKDEFNKIKELNKNNDIKKENNKNLLDVNKLSLIKEKKYGQFKVIDRKEILKYKNNFQNILKEISFQEIENNGSLSFKINFLKENSFFKNDLELLNDDVINEINNEKINDYSKLMFFFNNIEKLDKIEITLKRKNEIHKKTFELK